MIFCYSNLYENQMYTIKKVATKKNDEFYIDGSLALSFYCTIKNKLIFVKQHDCFYNSICPSEGKYYHFSGQKGAL